MNPAYWSQEQEEEEEEEEVAEAPAAEEEAWISQPPTNPRAESVRKRCCLFHHISSQFSGMDGKQDTSRSPLAACSFLQVEVVASPDGSFQLWLC